MHHMLRGEALRFFDQHIDGKESNWGSAIATFSKVFASSAKRNDISTTLRSLRIETFEVKDRSEKEALKCLTREIERLAPMSEKDDRSDRSMRVFLEQSCEGKEWALHVATNHDISEISYLNYRTLLERAQGRWAKFEQRKVDNSSIGDKGEAGDYKQSRWKVNFTGQGRYGRHPTEARKVFKDKNGNITTGGSGNKFGCFNCGKTDCSVRICRQPINFQQIAKRKAQYLASRNVAININDAFLDLAHELEDAIDDLSDHDTTRDQHGTPTSQEVSAQENSNSNRTQFVTTDESAVTTYIIEESDDTKTKLDDVCEALQESLKEDLDMDF